MAGHYSHIWGAANAFHLADVGKLSVAPRQRIGDGKRRKPAEIAVHAPQLAHPMLQAKCSNSRVMHHRAGDTPSLQQSAQLPPVMGGFSQQRHIGRFQPGIDLINGSRQWRGWFENFWMGHDGDEFMQARPWESPLRLAFRQSCHLLAGGLMPFGIFAMRIDKNIGVDRNHVPRPS